MSDSDELLETVAEVARAAGDVALGYFKSSLRVEAKGDGSPVTEADREAERTAREWISRRFPRDGIVGEELGAVNVDAPRRWLIDPIDGTRSFVRGVPLWGTLIAVANGEDVIAGAAYFPAVGEMLAASLGRGCWWNGSRASVSTVSDLADATVLTTDERFTYAPRRKEAWDRLSGVSAMSRTWGDCYGYLLVATGRAEVMIDGAMSAWDAAALLPLITEAGGSITDWSGRTTAFGGSTIATNAALSHEVRDILGVTRE